MTSCDAAETTDQPAITSKLQHASALLRDDSMAAVALLDRHIDDATKRSAWFEVGEFAYLAARAHMLQGDLNQALTLIDSSRDAWNTIGETLRANRTDLGRMNILDDMGDHEQAVAVGLRLIDRLDGTASSPDHVWLRGAAWKNVGVSQGYLGRHQQALDAYSQAEELYQEIGEYDDLALTQANRGVELLEIGDLAAAIDTLRRAATALREQGNTVYLARCLAYEGRAQLLAGDYLASRAAVDSAAELLHEREATVERARIDLVRADTMRSLNLLDDADALYTNLGSFLAEGGFVHDTAVAALGHGFVQALQGEKLKASGTLERAATLFRSVGDDGQAAVADIARSELLEAERAQALAHATLGRLDATSRPAERAAALLRCAQLETDDQRALDLVDEVEHTLEQQDIHDLRWRSLHERARRLRSMGDFEHALEVFMATMTLIENVRSTISRDLERTPFMTSRSAVHTDTVSLLLEMGDVERAYRLVQRARSRTLVEVIGGEVERAYGAPLPESVDRAYSSMVHATHGELEGSIEVKGPIELATGAQRRSAPNVETDASPAGATITYQVVDGHLTGFVRHGGQVRAVPLLVTLEHLDVLRHRLEAQWRRFDDPGLAVRQHAHLLSAVTDVLQQLHIGLLAPLDVLHVESLQIIPHGSISNLPFAAFHDGTCHLIERMPVTLAPSELAYSSHAARSAGAGASRLVVGVETPETPAVAAEVAALRMLQGTTTLTGEAATVGAFVRAVSEHDIIHVASHGIYRFDNPLFSALQFADRWLAAGELAALELHGQLVVLSACSSGRQGQLTEANELDGLPRALLAAGARSVAVNLWPVDDRAAALLMQSFHEHLADNTPSQALRSAQLHVMATKPHPYYWSPTVIIGAS